MILKDQNNSFSENKYNNMDRLSTGKDVNNIVKILNELNEILTFIN